MNPSKIPTRSLLLALVAGAVLVVAGCRVGPPAPAGQHQVGHRFFTLTDASRGEPHTEDPDDARFIGVQAWYPAVIDDPADYERPVYIDEETAAQLEKVQGIPSWVPLGTDAFAFEDAPILAGGLPVLIFNHGYASFATQNSVFAEHLASRGYLVLSIEHPYESLYAHDGKGGGVPAAIDDYLATAEEHFDDPTAYVRGAAALAEAARAAADDPVAYSEALYAITAEDPVLSGLGESFAVWVDDTRFLLNELSALNAGTTGPEWIAGHVDSSRIGLFGHSFGGIVATELNVKGGFPEGAQVATVNYDAAGMSWSEAEAWQPRRLSAPALFITATHSTVAGDAIFDTTGVNDGYVLHSDVDSWAYSLVGAGHQNFCDLTFVPLSGQLGLTGPGDGFAIGDTLLDHTARFFDASLRDGAAFNVVGEDLVVSHVHR